MISRVLLLLGALAGLAVGAYGLTAWEAAPSFAKSIVAIGAITALAFGLASRLKNEGRVMALICAGAAGFAIFAVNGWLMYQDTQPNPLELEVEAARKADPDWDDRTLLEVVRDMRKDGVDAVPYLIGRFAIDEDLDPPLLPLGGIATATTVMCNETGPWSIYAADEHGFNNPKGWPETVDIVILGDSYAHGACVKPDDAVSAKLREKGWSVVTLGISGYGPALQLATLTEFGLALKPKFVVWIWSDNDYNDLVYETTSPMLRRYVDDPSFSQKLMTRQDEVDAYWRRYLDRHELLAPKNRKKLEGSPGSNLRETLMAALKLRRLRKGLGLRRNDDEAAVVAQFSRVMQAAISRSESVGAQFYFIDLPFWHVAEQPPEERGPDFISFAKPLEGLHEIDFAQRLYESGDPKGHFPYRLPAHFNAKGYALLADQIDETLRAASKPASP